MTRRHDLLLLASLILLVTSDRAFAQRDLRDIPDPDPEIERSSFVVAEGFEVNLFAADPAIAKPIQMNFDPQGRLWIASSEIYPHIEPGAEANDKILIVEDADGDGTADRTTVFADGLLIPTGVEPGDGGAYVANSTELLHLTDTDGDGRADQRRIVLSGFGTEDTHHILHTLRWGPEGLLYFNQSIYIHSHIETPHGVRRLNGGGTWYFRPETLELDILMRGLCNPWGHDFDRWGQSFATDGAGGEGINYIVPGGTYFTSPGAVRTIQGLNPGSPKHCGLEIVSGRHLPDDWQGNLITNDFRAHRVCRFVLSQDGAGFASQQMEELITSDNVAFRPIDVKMGPDGAIYIADWYNPIIQHGEVDFRDPRRDHTHGRIWRVTAKDRPLVPRPNLIEMTTAELLVQLRAPENWTRHHAKRVLKERGREQVLPELERWIAGLDDSDPEAEHARLEGLWMYQALDVVEPELLQSLLRSADARIRAAATRVVLHWHTRLDDPLGLLSAQVADEFPRVRLEAVCALAAIPRKRSIELATLVLEQPMDRYLDHALWQAARDLRPVWQSALAADKLDLGDDLRRLTFLLEAAGSPDVVQPLMELVDSGRVPVERQVPLLELVATYGGPAELARMLERVADDSALPPEARATLLETLSTSAARRNVVPAADLAQVEPLLASPHVALRAAAARAVGRWKLTGLMPALIALVRHNETEPAVRAAGIEAVALLPGAESLALLQELSGSSHPPEVRTQAIAALSSLDVPLAAAVAVNLLAEAPEGIDATRLVRIFVDRREGPPVLATALNGVTLPADVAKLGLRVARGRGEEAAALVEALQAAGNLTATVEPTPELVAEIVAQVRDGDAARGELVFRREEQACLKCHSIAGAGGQVGPDLISIGASAQVDYLVESLLLPNKAVKENYHSLVVSTDDGRLITGVKVGQTDSELLLRDAEDVQLAIPLDSIDEQAPGQSLMPAGLVDELTRQELVDLVRFLSELGKPGPYAVGRETVVRRWQQLVAHPESIQLFQRQSIDQAASDDPALRWSPAYSTVAGGLPVSELPELKIRREQAPFSFARCELDVSTGGPITLQLNSSGGLILWVDEWPTPVADHIPLKLAAGVHRLTWAIDRGQRREPLRLEIIETPGSRAQVKPIGGK